MRKKCSTVEGAMADGGWEGYEAWFSSRFHSRSLSSFARWVLGVLEEVASAGALTCEDPSARCLTLSELSWEKRHRLPNLQ